MLWILEGNEAAFHLYREFGFAYTGKKQPLEDNPNPMRNERLMSLVVSEPAVRAVFEERGSPGREVVRRTRGH
jgi:hypothetical protein